MMTKAAHPFLTRIAEIRKRDPALSRQEAVAAATRQAPVEHANWLHNQQRNQAAKNAVVAAYM